MWMEPVLTNSLYYLVFHETMMQDPLSLEKEILNKKYDYNIYIVPGSIGDKGGRPIGGMAIFTKNDLLKFSKIKTLRNNMVEVKYFGLAMIFPYMKYDNDKPDHLLIYKEELNFITNRVNIL